MNRIENVNFKALESPRFIRPTLMTYTQEGKEKSWEIAQVHDSVAILIYHKDEDAFILVKQFRPPVYLKNENGFTYELCAGICDKDLDLASLACEEVLEETGYLVDSTRLKKISSFYTAVGFAGSSQTLFYLEVTNGDKEHDGGGVEEEAIEVVKVSRKDAREFIFNETFAKTPGLMFGFMWWFDQNP